MTPFIAEILGTFVLVLLGGGVVANVVLAQTKGNSGGWIVITTAWALAVFTGVSIAGPYSGAHLNPAVTLSVFLIGEMPWEIALQYVLAQFIGAMLGAFCVWVFYKKHFDVTTDPGLTQAVFCTSPAIRNYANNFFSETLGTFVLILTILFFQEPVLELNETAGVIGLGSIGAIPVAFVVWVIGLSLGGTTGYAINPARDLGPRMVYALLPIKHKAGFDARYAWIPVLGPFTGATLASLLFLYLK